MPSWLQNDHGLLVRCAASDDSKDAREAIACFKGRQKPAIDALVTVGMAYEGLDVPAIIHIACLTRYRSRYNGAKQCFSQSRAEPYNGDEGMQLLPPMICSCAKW